MSPINNNFNNFIKFMLKQQEVLSPKTAYLTKLTDSHEQEIEARVGQNNIRNYINQGIQKIEHQLKTGGLSIQKKKQIYSNIPKSKNDIYRKQMDYINRQIQKNDQMYKQAKKQMLTNKKALLVEQKQKNQAKRRQIQQKVKKWSEIQKQLKEKHERLSQDKRIKQLEQEQKRKQQQQEQLEFNRLQKKKLIQQRLYQIQQNKLKRQEIIKQSQCQIRNLNPIYKQIEKKFIDLQKQAKFQEEIIKKNKIIAMKIDHQALKAHQKAFISKLQERKSLNKSSHSNSQENDEKKPEFNMLLTKDQTKTALEKQKAKRRKQFQQKLKQIPIIIDEAKKVRVQIEIDKGKNKIKYNFLGQKALNDFQIYGQFKQFQMNLNSKQRGDEYLKQLPQITKNSRMQKSKSLHTLRQSQKFEKTKYKDYLQQQKAQRTSRITKTQDQIKSIIKTHKQKQKALLELSERIKRYDLQAKKKIGDLQKMNGFRSSLHKERQIDDLYLKSIKTKLACLQINQ